MSRIDPEKDFAGFVDQRLWLALRRSWEGCERVIAARQSMAFIGAIPDDIYAIEDLARHFDRAAAEIRSIAKAIRRNHGITADDEIRREREAVEERRHARADIPALIAHIRKLEAERLTAEERELMGRACWYMRDALISKRTGAADRDAQAIMAVRAKIESMGRGEV